MKATCHNNPKHKNFLTTVHVVQEWLVDSEGNFLKVAQNCTGVVAKPMKGNIWYCATCEAEATVED